LKFTNISKELELLKRQARTSALEYGLDFFEVIFEMCDYEALCQVAAYTGFPKRYPHWKFGMEYQQLLLNNTYGWGKIYELVINNDPSYAYLLKSNSEMIQKLVMAHVYGHSDFFKQNIWYSNTDRSMIDTMARHGDVISALMNQYGAEEVEDFITAVLSLENLIDIREMFENEGKKREREYQEGILLDELKKKEEEDERYSSSLDTFLRSKAKIDGVSSSIKENNKDLESQLNKIQKPERDILKFLHDEAPLKDWQRTIIHIIRKEAYYFLPQRMTKIMNEGWASYWHSKIMINGLMNDNELFDYAELNASVFKKSSKQLNPYRLGLDLFNDIEERWDKGRYGLDYLKCRDMYKKEHWNTQENKGRDKMFEVRTSHNDLTFLNEFLTEEFCVNNKFFVYKTDQRTGRLYKDTSDFPAIKFSLIRSLTNAGEPIIEAIDSNYNNAHCLYLLHSHEGIDLDVRFAEETLKNLFMIWKRPVLLETKVSIKKDNKEEIVSKIYEFNARGFSQR